MHALKASEQRNRALLQALPDSIVIVDGNGMLTEHISRGGRASYPQLRGLQ